MNELQKAQVRKENKALMLQRMTDFFMDYENSSGVINISPNLLAEKAIDELVQASRVDELFQLKTA